MSDPAFTVIGRGVYSFPDAALYARISARRARSWFDGSLFTPDYPEMDGDRSISFLDLVELAAASQLARNGRPKREIRAIRERLPGPHAFARQGLKASRLGLSRLLKQFDYVDGMADRWHIAPGVFLSPHHRFGAPLAECYISTHCLASAYRVEGYDAEVVARWYEVEPEHVRRAVAFERMLARRLAASVAPPAPGA